MTNGARINQFATLSYLYSRGAITLNVGGLPVRSIAHAYNRNRCTAGNAGVLPYWRCLPCVYSYHLWDFVLLFFRIRRNKQSAPVFRWNGCTVNAVNNNNTNRTGKQPIRNMKKSALLIFAFMLLIGSYTPTDTQTTQTPGNIDTVFAEKQDSHQSIKDSVTDFELFLKGLLGQELKPKN